MTPVRASAPGKLLLFGEYAVLAGGRGVVMAVDRRAHVTVEAVDSEDLVVCAPQLGLAGEGLVFDPERPERLLGLSGRWLARRLAHYGLEPAGLQITIDTAELFDADADGSRVKLGLGSSAAVSAALDTALAAWAEVPAGTLDGMLSDYRAAIGGPASGADLAASLQGGLLRVQAGGDRLVATRASWPEGLHARPVWVGRPASTPAFAAAFDGWQSRSPDTAEHWVARVDALTCSALDAGRAEAWIASARGWFDALLELQAALGVEIVTAPHRRLAEFAAEAGVAYKTCGAGGGDFGVALATDPERLAAFGRRTSAAGARPVELRIEPSGACVAEGRGEPTEGA